MIDFLYTSVLKKTQLMPSHLYKYLSGDYLILQAIDSYPSIPRPGCLEHPLHLVLWHHKKLLFPLLFLCKTKTFYRYHIKRGSLPLSRNCLRSCHGKSRGRINLLYHFIQTRDSHFLFRNVKYIYIYSLVKRYR